MISEYRSITESKNAPNLVTRPRVLATCPSSMSNRLATIISRPAAKKKPYPYSTPHPILINNPMNVSAFGLILLRASALTRVPSTRLPPAPMASLIIVYGPDSYAITVRLPRARKALLSQSVGLLVKKASAVKLLRRFEFPSSLPRVVDRRELHNFEPALARRSDDFNLVSLLAPHQAFAYRGGVRDLVLRNVGVFGHHQLVDYFMTGVLVVQKYGGAVGYAVAREPRRINHCQVGEALSQVGNASSNIVLTIARGLVFGILGQVAEGYGLFEFGW